MSRDFNDFATPSEKMAKDLDALEKVNDFSKLTKEEREKAEAEIKAISESMMSGQISPDQYNKNKEILGKLKSKGFSAASEALSKITTEAKDTLTEKKFEAEGKKTGSPAIVTQPANKRDVRDTLAQLCNKGEGLKNEEEKNTSRDSVQTPKIHQHSDGNKTVDTERSEIKEFLDRKYGRTPRKVNDQTQRQQRSVGSEYS